MKVLHSVLLVGAIGGAACSKSAPANDPTTVSMTSPPTSPTTPDPTSTTVITTTSATVPTAQAPAVEPVAVPAAAQNSSPSAQDGLLPPAPAPATDTPPAPKPAVGGGQPDNSAVNKRDRSSSALTPMSQGGSESDRNTTQRIRQAVVKDSSLSFTAKNVKIITVNGKVTLRGPVKTDQERSAIEAAAKRVAGETEVDNQLEIKK